MPKAPGWMSAEFFDQQKIRLEELRDQLLGLEGKLVREVQTFNAERDGEPLEFEDAAQNSSLEESRQGLHDVDLKRLASIERALQKIEQGTYGFSDATGKIIPRPRLDAVPEAILRLEEVGAAGGAGHAP